MKTNSTHGTIGPIISILDINYDLWVMSVMTIMMAKV